mmetsp:Transcript_34618/g.82696  ORF Transcript_34618/g.82696 Transcript_34618/m.82696 type:complete len:237 (+) Transcript_34618:1813-2523(+)
MPSMPRSCLSCSYPSAEMLLTPSSPGLILRVKKIWYMSCRSDGLKKPTALFESYGSKSTASNPANRSEPHPASFRTDLQVSLAAMTSMSPLYVAAALFTLAKSLTRSIGAPRLWMTMLPSMSSRSELLMYSSFCRAAMTSQALAGEIMPAMASSIVLSAVCFQKSSVAEAISKSASSSVRPKTSWSLLRCSYEPAPNLTPLVSSSSFLAAAAVSFISSSFARTSFSVPTRTPMSAS